MPNKNIPTKIHKDDIKKPTQQQEKFIQGYLKLDLSQTAAARYAGYKNAPVSAVELLNKPHIQARIQEEKENMRAQYGVTLEKSIRDLKIIQDKATKEGNYQAAIKAIETRLKATGFLINKTHITHENVKSLPRDQTIQKLNSILENAKNRQIIDITPSNNTKKITNEKNPSNQIDTQSLEEIVKNKSLIPK